MRPERLVRLVRRAMLGLYAVLLLAAAYGFWRYEVVALPAEGCSPLAGFEPGDRLVIDRAPGPLDPGSAVLFRAEGQVHLGRLGEPPGSAPEDVWGAFEAGALWLVGERPDCPGTDSLRLGPVPRAAVEGRILFTLPW